MRIALALLVVVMVASPVAAEPVSRAEAVVDALGVDEPIARKLIELLTAHDQELAKLQRKRSEYKRQLVSAHHLDAKAVDRLLDDALQNQRALADADLRLVARVRQLVPAPKAVQLLFLLSATEPTAPTAGEDAPRLARGSVCDPFASMHGCRY